ncbi:MAG: pantothenate kinase [Coxiella sp. DG_40]|nr:MAG: pantothenate kinase [Coxiella sp. DG_40]
MILCLDIGNTQVFGGVFVDRELQLNFRHDTTQSYTSDQLGIFLRSVLRENNIDYEKINQIAICSVVPHLDYSIRAACMKYFSLEPFMLQPGVKTGIKIKYSNPLEVGADIIAEAIAAVNLYPRQNVITVDFGTATTLCPVNAQKEFLGGLIIPGMRLCMESLQSHTAKLPTVKIVKPTKILGYSTIESIQSGLYYGQLAAVKEITSRLTEEIFAGEKPIVIGTGGFAYLFADENVFTKIIPNMVLEGLWFALQINK